MNDLYLYKCIYHIHDGLCSGLSRFSGPSRAALIFCLKEGDPIRVHDPQNLLQGHEPRLAELYLKDHCWIDCKKRELQDELVRCDNLGLSGLISFGGRSKSMFYQMWFTEHHPDICSVGPTERWLEHACRLTSQDLGTEGAYELGTSGYVLQDFATHAVRDHIIDVRNISVGIDTQLRIYPILETILGISKTQEEGHWAHGDLIFVEPSLAHRVHYMATFGIYERPSLNDVKHIRKLLQTVEGNKHKLVCDGHQIIGIGTGKMPDFSVTASFRGRHGFIEVQDELICSFSDGSYHSSNRKANLVYLEEILMELHLDPNKVYSIMKIVGELVSSAQERKHGCALVLDYGSPLANISGQHLEVPLDLRRHMDLELAKELAKVDGALHIDMMYMKLHAFAALLDGRTVPGENRARGARFNSALRFTAEHKEAIVVVVSADRPISIMQHGAMLTSQCEWEPRYKCLATPPTLAGWASTDIK